MYVLNRETGKKRHAVTLPLYFLLNITRDEEFFRKAIPTFVPLHNPYTMLSHKTQIHKREMLLNYCQVINNVLYNK